MFGGTYGEEMLPNQSNSNQFTSIDQLERYNVLQPSDDRCGEFVPSAVDKPLRKSQRTKGSQGGDFQLLTKSSLKSDEPLVELLDPSTGLLYFTELTEDSVNELIDEPGNEGKSVILSSNLLSKGGQRYAITCGPEGTYTEDKDFKMISGYFGKGGYSKTQWIQDNTTNAHMIRKEIKKPVFKSKEILALIKLREIRYFPRLYGFMSHEDTVSIFMEYHGGFSFNKVVENHQFRYLLSFKDCIIDIARQGFHSLEYLRTKGIIHMDIKPENLCLKTCDNGRLELMVCDLGSCVIGSLDENVAISGWTVAYMTPEMCRFSISTWPGCQSMWQKEDKLISTQSDVYQLCASLLYLIYFKHWQEVHPDLEPEWKQPGSLYLQSSELFQIKVATSELLQTLIKPEWDESLKTVFRGGFCGRPSERITPQQALHILQMRTVPVGIDVPCSNTLGLESVHITGIQSVCPAETSNCSSRKRRSGDLERSSSNNLNAICIDDEPPEKLVPRDMDVDLSAPGNLPNLAALFNC